MLLIYIIAFAYNYKAWGEEVWAHTTRLIPLPLVEVFISS